MAGSRELKEVTFRVYRYDPAGKEGPGFKTYTIPFTRGMTVLDGLIYIKENLDGSLSFRTSCRMGVCGSCGVLVNGFPHLACHTQITELGAEVLEVRPLPNYRVVKDLVVDLTPLFEKHQMVKPYIIRPDKEEVENPTREFLQTPEELERYLQFAYCLKCGLCLAACPTVATDAEFLGPQALGQAYRYEADSRDGAGKERLKVVSGAHGAWRCHFAGACSQACPKGVDPALAVQLLKRKLILNALGFGKKKKLAPVAPPVEKKTPRPGIPEPPPPSV